MVAHSGFVHPTNKVVVQGKPEVLDRTAEVDTIKPGLVVKRGTTQDLIKLGDFSTQTLGFAGYEQASQPNFSATSIYEVNRPEGLTGAYAQGAKVPVLYLANFILLSKMQAGSAAFKGDDLACLSGGELVAGKMTDKGFAIRVPFVKKTDEFATGLVLPAGAIVSDVFIEVATAAAGSSIDVGLLETGENGETGGDADGFLDGESCAVAGYVQHVEVGTSAAANTLGALLVASDIKTADQTPLYMSVPKKHVCDGIAKTVSYTTSNHTVAGNIYIVIEGLKVIAQSVEDVSAGATVLVRSLL